MSSPGYVGTQGDVILSRVGAFFIDHILMTIVVVAGTVGLLIERGISNVPDIEIVTLAFLCYIGYFVIFEGLFGRTIGKRLFGIIVVSRDESSITMRQSIVRNLFRVVDGLGNYTVGLLVMLHSEDSQRIGDLAADTLVVRAQR